MDFFRFSRVSKASAPSHHAAEKSARELPLDAMDFRSALVLLGMAIVLAVFHHLKTRNKKSLQSQCLTSSAVPAAAAGEDGADPVKKEPRRSARIAALNPT